MQSMPRAAEFYAMAAAIEREEVAAAAAAAAQDDGSPKTEGGGDAHNNPVSTLVPNDPFGYVHTRCEFSLPRI
jgi:hypothetical protein